MPRKKPEAGIGEFGGAPVVADWGGSATTMPLYWFYEATQSSLGPARAMADAGKHYFKNPANPASHTEWGRKVSALCEVFERATRRYGKPEFGLLTTLVRGERVAVTEKVVWSRPFCNLLHFERSLRPDARKQPKLLIVAPMSGHYATLLRGTVETMLPDHDVYITDWTDARLVPLSDGAFDLDDYIDYLISMFHFLKGDCHVMAVCQPAVPVLAAVARMEAEDDPFIPHSMTLMGGPIDTRENPTGVNELAIEKGTEWFQSHVVTMVPWPHPGAMRQVYPGFLQLTGFVSMNLDRHVEAHKEFFTHLVDGDGDSAEKHRDFYDEYLAVMDLTGEFYLQTVDTVFVRQALAKGEMMHRGKLVDCSKITRCALMTVEGERDDISGVGQTKAAHRLCSNLAEDKRVHYLQERVGHYGVFNGSRFRAEIAPRIHDFILSNQPGMARAAPVHPAAPAEPALKPVAAVAAKAVNGAHADAKGGAAMAAPAPARAKAPKAPAPKAPALKAPAVKAAPSAAAPKAAAEAPPVAKPTPVAVKPETTKAARAKVAPQVAAPKAAALKAADKPAVAAAAKLAETPKTPEEPKPVAEPKPAAESKTVAKPATSPKPSVAAEPQGAADDLTKITGVGPKLQTLLNEAGIFHYAQIAGLTAKERAALDAKMAPPGRIARDKWVEQAARLAKAN